MARKPKPDNVKPSRTRTVSTSESGGDVSAARPPKTIAEGRALIEQAYRVAQEFFFQTIIVECHRSCLKTIRSFAYFEIDPPEDIEHTLERWKRYSEKAFSELETAFNRLAELKPRLDDAFAPVIPLLDYAAAELEPIKTTRGNYRHAYGYLALMSYHQTDYLFRLVRSIFSLKYVPPFSSELNMAYENIERAATPEPIRQLIESRLLIERSQLARDLPNYLAYAGELSGLDGKIVEANKRRTIPNAGRKPAKLSRDERKIIEAWNSGRGEFKTLAEVDRFFDKPEGHSKKIVDKVRKRVDRRTK